MAEPKNKNTKEVEAASLVNNQEEVIKTPLELENEELKAKIEKLKAENSELEIENEELKVAISESDETNKLLQTDLDELSKIPAAQSLLSGLNPLGSIEEYEGQSVFVAPNGDRYILSDEAPERFNFLNANKSKVEWSRDIEAMAELVKSRSNFVKFLK